jgi:hypothetical protein
MDKHKQIDRPTDKKTDKETPALISFLGLLPRQRGRCLLKEEGSVTDPCLGTCLGTGLAHTDGFLYLMALLAFLLFFRFIVLV